jgi:hypothetical protein
MSRIYFFCYTKKNVEIVTIFVVSRNLPTFVFIISYRLSVIKCQIIAYFLCRVFQNSFFIFEKI